MNAAQLARLKAIEATIADNRRTAEIACKPAHELSDAEAVEEIRRLVQRPAAGFAPQDLSRWGREHGAEIARIRAMIL